MGFKYWYEGVMFVTIFGVLVLTPCFFTATIGSKMINDVGNFPTKAEQIQQSALWKVVLIEAVAFVLLAAFFNFFS